MSSLSGLYWRTGYATISFWEYKKKPQNKIPLAWNAFNMSFPTTCPTAKWCGVPMRRRNATLVWLAVLLASTCLLVSTAEAARSRENRNGGSRGFQSRQDRLRHEPEKFALQPEEQHSEFVKGKSELIYVWTFIVK